MTTQTKYDLFIKYCNSICNLTNILNKTVKQNNYEQLQKILSDKQNQDSIQKMFQIYEEYSDIKIFNTTTPRKFLLAWMIYGFPHIVFETDFKIVDTYPHNIWISCKNMIEYFINICEKSIFDSENFNNIITDYIENIQFFIQTDKQYMIKKLVSEYCEMVETINYISESKKYDSEQKKNTIEVINMTKNKIFKYLKFYDKQITHNNLEKVAKFSINLNKQVIKQYEKILVDDLMNKNFIFLSQLIGEIKNNLINFGSDRVDVEEKLDTEFIIQLIQTQNIEYQHIDAYGDYLNQQINKLQSSATIQDTNQRWLDINNNKSDYNIYQYISKIIFNTLYELEQIKLNICSLQTISSIGINIFNL